MDKNLYIRNYKKCDKCNKEFLAKYWWDETGYGYSTKLTKCPDCGKIFIKESDDYGISK